MTEPLAISPDHLFDSLTAKQRETMDLLCDGWTSKEIATKLGVSESAVVQRIETVRAKSGGLLRKELVRLYRDYASAGEADCKQNTGKIFQLSEWEHDVDTGIRNDADDDLVLSDAMSFHRSAPWASQSEPRVVPEVLDGDSATLYRLLAAVGLALGMVALTLILLAVAEALGNLV
ncbi:LuxR family transcriptional regulator [Aurantiacibacter xanthus]|uniref:LuxR family transcriptional regulator n=1 Tax=Aurantiacibacter xanthus TaxID=1784712 RepID=A0A3A1PHT2_9SPHN|nr:sigma factor-like helix-turn-helix DNA-binding protein [Aurantiacibacter xanthus]RIV93410.1 LuxR family transcriptional regulator [Aurantiacibacter xanthus]